MEILVAEEVKTAEVFDYIILAFEKRWSKLFGDPMTFRATIDKFGKLHLVSTNAIPNFQLKARKMRKMFRETKS